MTFSAHCREGALRFLHTALVIDDRAQMGGDSDDVDVKVANRASASILGKQALPEGQPPAPEVARGSLSKTPLASAGTLDAKALTDAFLDKEIICGVHRHEGENTSVALAVRAATRADIVVVDWLLEGKNSVTAKEIVKQILKADAAEHGRARLVAIYTSEPGRNMVAREMFEVLQAEPELKDRLRLSADGLRICGVDTRIAVFNKIGTPQAQDVLTVTEAELPNHLVDEFVHLTDGLLSNFAVSSVAAIRRGAHHVLALFGKDLDGVYVAHRCSIKNPDEAADLAMGLISSALAGLIENAGVPDTTLDPSIIDTWLDRESKGRVFATDKARLPVALVKEMVRKGNSRRVDKAGQMQVGQDKPPNTTISEKTITTVFYDSDVAARTAARRFSRLSNFKREAGRLRPSDNFKPMLALGALLKVRNDLFEGAGIDCDYLLCMQPICDAVRLKETTAFPFQTAEYDKTRFNLIVDEAGAAGYLNLELKPRATVMFRFDPTSGRDTVYAEPNAAGDFLFTDSHGRKFQWIGDIASLKAQAFASEVAANQHRVGGDELEWLRLGAAGKITPDSK